MKTFQDLYDYTTEQLRKEIALRQGEGIEGNLWLYHTGKITAYTEIARTLINKLGCKATFIDTKETV